MTVPKRLMITGDCSAEIAFAQTSWSNDKVKTDTRREFDRLLAEERQRGQDLASRILEEAAIEEDELILQGQDLRDEVDAINKGLRIGALTSTEAFERLSRVKPAIANLDSRQVELFAREDRARQNHDHPVEAMDALRGKYNMMLDIPF
jgi:hypothetical protein